MVSRADNSSLNLKPLNLPQTATNPISTIKNIFLLCKQVWYIPFFWTLTWFTYWILRAVIVLNTSLTQLNPIDLAGATISTSMLIIATPRLGTTIRKTSFLAAKHAGTNIKKAFTQTVHTRFDVENKIPPPSRSKVMNNIQNIRASTLKLEAPPMSYQASIGIGREKLEQKLKGVPEKLTLPRSGASALAGGVGYANEHSASQELLMECLTCENLINCRHRRSKPVEAQVGGFQTSKCPLAQELSTNKATAS